MTPTVKIEEWRRVFRNGLAPLLTHDELKALEYGLENNDPALIQEVTVSPPVSASGAWRPGGACIIGYCGWKGDELDTCKQVEDFFLEMCVKIDKACGYCKSHDLIYWWDTADRAKAIAKLLPEVKLALAQRLYRKEDQDGDL